MNSGSWFWPDVTTLDGASTACRTAMWFSIAVASITALMALIALSGNVIAGVGASAFVDAALFAAIAFGLSRRSRFAAVSGFLLFLLERIYMIVQTGSVLGAGVLGIVFLIGFLNGVRGAFAYHKLLTQQPVASPPFS